MLHREYISNAPPLTQYLFKMLTKLVLCSVRREVKRMGMYSFVWYSFTRLIQHNCESFRISACRIHSWLMANGRMASSRNGNGWCCLIYSPFVICLVVYFALFIVFPTDTIKGMATTMHGRSTKTENYVMGRFFTGNY